MSDNLQKKFNEIEKRLNELEEIFITKIAQKEITPEILDIEEANKSELLNKINEKNKIIENLNKELNNAQKTIKDIGKENDFLKDKNRLFADKVFKFKSQGSKLIQLVEDDIEQIKEIIKNKLK